MKRIIYLVLFLVAPECFAHVGVANETYNDKARNREINTTIVYPTLALPQKEFAQNAAFYGFQGTSNADVNGDKLPLYIIAHGTSGNWRNLSWLVSQLAESGAIVVSANHPNYTSGEASPDKIIRMWDQPKDISFLIDKILSSSYSKYIDSNNITVIGYSLGGYTSLALAGVRLDIKRYIKFCRLSSDKSCQYFEKAFSSLTESDLSQSAMSYADSRVTRVVAIAPGFVPAMKADSLLNMPIPSLVVSAEFDENVPPKTQLEPYLMNKYKNVSYAKIEGASHFSFMQNCTPKAIPILAEEGAEFVCIEPKDRDRKLIHNELVQLLSEFTKVSSSSGKK